MDFIWRALFILIFGPLILGVALQMLVCFVVAVLPWLIALAVVAGTAAGLAAGFVLRRKLEGQHGAGQPTPGLPLGTHRVRRPRGVDRR
jgi:hypothetical protein